MKDTVILPPELSSQVESVGGIVVTDDVDTFGKLRQIEDKSHKLRTIMQAWEKQQEEERMELLIDTQQLVCLLQGMAMLV